MLCVQDRAERSTYFHISNTTMGQSHTDLKFIRPGNVARLKRWSYRAGERDAIPHVGVERPFRTCGVTAASQWHGHIAPAEDHPTATFRPSQIMR